MRRAPGGTAVGEGQLRACPRTSSNPSCSPRQGRLHRARPTSRVCSRRPTALAPARRDHRDAHRPPGQALARAGGRTFRRIGGAKSISSDFRLISSTNRNSVLAPRRATAAGPLLPHQHRDDHHPAPARARRGHPGAGPGLPRALPVQARATVEGIAPDAYRQLCPTAGRQRAGAQHAIEQPSSSRAAERLPSRPARTTQGGAAVVAKAVPTGSLEEIERASILRPWSRRAGTSRPRPRCSGSAGRRSIRRCASTTSPAPVLTASGRGQPVISPTADLRYAICNYLI